MSAALTTLQRRLGRAGVVRAGAERAYRRLAYGPGEPRLERDELAPGAAPLHGELLSLCHLAQITDLQLADVQSPGRFEFLERLRGRPGAGVYVPATRPQEALVAQAAGAMLETFNRLGPSAETGAGLRLCISTGDSLDNAQLNELQWFLTLLCGGTLAANSGGPRYEGVQAPGWRPDAYWSPEPGPDPYKDRYGFPTHPGLLAEALAPFEAPGLQMPWLSCFGNHDGLVLGTALPAPAYEAVLTGARKPADLSVGLDPMALVEEFISNPKALEGGPAHEVTPDAGRASIGRRAFVAAHLEAGGWPEGHGFSRRNLADETAYCCYDLDGPVPVRVIVLDTTNMDGGFEGSIGARQCAFLEQRLVEVHSRHLEPDGTLVASGAADRLVVLASHHGLATMTNERRDPLGFEDDHPRIGAGALESLLHRFANVVVWLNGHRHLNEIVPRPDPSGRTGGFWEVSTASIADWPCQSRLVELVADRRGELAILCTMLDAAVPDDPAAASGIERLAALHRELAANDPFVDDRTEGGAGDRNVALRIRPPFRFW